MRIYEIGNGFPEVGDYVTGHDGYPYKIEKINRNIHTSNFQGNWIEVEASQADWVDVAEGEEFPAFIFE